MSKSNKYEYQNVIQSYYQQGWHDVAYSEDLKEARQELKNYEEIQPFVPHRISTHRLKPVESDCE